MKKKFEDVYKKIINIEMHKFPLSKYKECEIQYVKGDHLNRIVNVEITGTDIALIYCDIQFDEDKIYKIWVEKTTLYDGTQHIPFQPYTIVLVTPDDGMEVYLKHLKSILEKAQFNYDRVMNYLTNPEPSEMLKEEQDIIDEYKSMNGIKDTDYDNIDWNAVETFMYKKYLEETSKEEWEKELCVNIPMEKIPQLINGEITEDELINKELYKPKSSTIL